ncbi:MAG: acyltransferase [Pseudomonadota bacterium]|nr:acyltransferase [Pseudomonadota bacterium]
MEWLRLIFATQVVLVHAHGHIALPIPRFISHFPGVPAFFFVSGFLIYASYLNAPGLRYFENRFLRLFPGLILVTIAGAIIVLISHGWSDLFENIKTYLIWFLAQITLGQAYNPGLFRDVGVGVINGSLWTLTTEILFYLSVPIIVWLERHFRFTVLVLLILSFAVYATGPLVFTTQIYREKTLYDIIGLTPLVWGWMFATGILAVKHFARLQRWLPYMPWLIIPILLMIFFRDALNGLLFGCSGNKLGLIYFTCYIGMVLWFAFVVPSVRLRFDLSYGAYIWHMPVINILLVLNEPRTLLSLVLTYLFATISWFLVERPALKLKRQSLAPIQTR